MHGLNKLKSAINITKKNIECPVAGCTESVSRKRQGDDLSGEDITCPHHNIEIRSSTFIYPNKNDNLLWTDDKDQFLLNDIEKVKRESRMEYDNSEDAVTWNIFRYLHKNNIAEALVEDITGEKESVEDIIYWSYSVKQSGSWCLLKVAQRVFGEQDNRGSEPDMAIETDRSIIFIEAKFNSGNTTTPSSPKKSLPKYSKGGDHWSKKVFNEPLEKIALERKRYELMRFWLLGSWMSNQIEKDFYLINLVRKANQENLNETLMPAISESKDEPLRQLKRVNWEDIYRMLKTKSLLDPTLDHYFQNKISGFGTNGKMKKAFDL